TSENTIRFTVAPLPTSRKVSCDPGMLLVSHVSTTLHTSNALIPGIVPQYQAFFGVATVLRLPGSAQTQTGHPNLSGNKTAPAEYSAGAVGGWYVPGLLD